jgi:hypothetical protein
MIQESRTLRLWSVVESVGDGAHLPSIGNLGEPSRGCVNKAGPFGLELGHRTVSIAVDHVALLQHFHKLYLNISVVSKMCTLSWQSYQMGECVFFKANHHPISRHTIESVCPLTVSNINHHSFLHPYLMD